MAGDVNSRSTTLTTPHDRPDMRIIVKEEQAGVGNEVEDPMCCEEVGQDGDLKNILWCLRGCFIENVEEIWGVLDEMGKEETRATWRLN